MKKKNYDLIFNSNDIDYLKEIIKSMLLSHNYKDNYIDKLKKELLKYRKTNIVLIKENYNLYKILKERKE